MISLTRRPPRLNDTEVFIVNYAWWIINNIFFELISIFPSWTELYSKIYEKNWFDRDKGVVDLSRNMSYGMYYLLQQ
jgi:hypothetical protein